MPMRERAMWEGHFEKYPPVGDVFTHYLLARLLEMIGPTLGAKRADPDAKPEPPDPKLLKYTDYAWWLKNSGLDHVVEWTEDDYIEYEAERLGALLAGQLQPKPEPENA